MALTDAQRAVIRSGLHAAAQFGFALAGSGALIEHGLVERLTDDADLFSSFDHADAFDLAADAVFASLQADGFAVTLTKTDETFRTFLVETPDGETVSVDLSLDWRRYNPAEISIGPILDVQDAAAAKATTIYSRGEARDFIDLWAIRNSGLWTDAELFAMVRDRDDDLDLEMYQAALKSVDKYDDERFTAYGLSLDEVRAVRAAAVDFGAAIRDESTLSTSVPDHTGDVHVKAHLNAGAPRRRHWRRKPKRN